MRGGSSTALKKMTLVPVILMIFTSVFGFTNMSRDFYLMGYAAIPWYLITGVCFFILYAFMLSEYGAAFQSAKGGIYSWMSQSVGPRFAFIGTFMWYASYVIWMVDICSTIWIPLSNAIFGSDTTQTWSILGLTATQTLGILGALWILAVTYVITKGIREVEIVASIGGSAVAFLNVLLLVGAVVVLLASKGHLAQPIPSARAFVLSPNGAYQTPLGVLSFIVFAIFAYGGLEVVGGLSDKADHPERTMPRAITIAAFIITIGYSVGVFLIGIFTNWQQVLASHHVNLGNVAYVVMQHLGYQVGLGMGLGPHGSAVLAAWVARFVGLSMFLALMGAFVVLGYAPLKQLIEGPPRALWPGRLGDVEDDVPKYALWVQCALVLVLILVISFGGEGVSTFFNYLVLMTNVAMTLPYLFLSIAFIWFKKNASIAKPFQVYRRTGSAWVATVVVTFTVGFANLFTIIQPALTGDWKSTVWMVVGPVFFAVVALALYGRYERLARSGHDERGRRAS
ncbi:MAG: glutamate/gamma-aminobutyrate family transporter YjeM [Alicyclobacillus sp.]|nr:glutamate/gamma-aminobutyrate family transporter YjeM [Alicyclobacillus sp.]